MPAAVLILLIVLLIIALRRATSIVIPIWAIMASGAVAALLLQQISPVHALRAIEPEVMFYLFGVFLFLRRQKKAVIWNT
ncbi:hypothetical protein [uncultured Legionella sp.]|uniref:hypothetical protein n=1 Tax=uncultured Legionella sp. TaxID=210934 RepID=UPI002614F929|nr:hypothetical protein [uncultured Legionella sp.]